MTDKCDTWRCPFKYQWNVLVHKYDNEYKLRKCCDKCKGEIPKDKMIFAKRKGDTWTQG